MLKYTRNELSEKELEDRIIKHPDLIENGLIYLEHQRHTTTGRLDILFVDNNKILTIAELKVVEDAYMLFQALDYFDFVAEKIESFARLHPQQKIDVEKYPRLMLIAPNFSPILINRCKWFNPDIQISLLVYQYIKFDEISEDTLVFIPHELSVPPTIISKAPEIDELLSYIKIDTAKGLAKRFLEEIANISREIVIDPLQWGKSIKYQGYVLCYWEPRQSYIRISSFSDDEEWESIKVSDENHYDKAIGMIKNTIKRWDNE